MKNKALEKLVERLISKRKIDPITKCWLWQGNVTERIRTIEEVDMDILCIYIEIIKYID